MAEFSVLNLNQRSKPCPFGTSNPASTRLMAPPRINASCLPPHALRALIKTSFWQRCTLTGRPVDASDGGAGALFLRSVMPTPLNGGSVCKQGVCGSAGGKQKAALGVSSHSSRSRRCFGGPRVSHALRAANLQSQHC